MPINTVIAEDAADIFTEADWLEMMATAKPGGADVMGIDTAEAVLVGYVPTNKARSAYAFFRGYSIAGDPANADYGLYRTNPARHPKWPFLYVRSCQFESIQPFSDTTKTTIRFPTGGSGDTATNPAYFAAVDAGNKLKFGGKYRYDLVTLHFGQYPYSIMEDDDPIFEALNSLEVYRNCNFFESTEPNLETISASTGRYLTFFEGDPIGQTFPGDVLEYKMSTNYTLAWDNVAEDFTHNRGYAPKILKAVGCVNAVDFEGFPAGTLLMYPPKFRRYQQPLRTNDTGYGLGIFANDIRFNIGHFDPEPAVGYGNSILRGWQLFPWFEGARDPIGSGSGAGGVGWYSAYRPDGTPYLKTYDFYECFEHWAEP